MNTREIMAEFTRLFYTEHEVETAFMKFVAEDYIQHNPFLTDGRDVAIKDLGNVFTPEASFEIQRMVIDDNLAVVHLKATVPGRPVLSVMDMYRFENGMIVEHWDVLSPMPEKPVSPHPMF